MVSQKSTIKPYFESVRPDVESQKNRYQARVQEQEEWCRRLKEILLV